MSIITRVGFDFGFDSSACGNCDGNCCCGESGNIWINQQELQQIAQVLHINVIDCVQQYCKRVGSRLTLQEHFSEHGLSCVFFDNARRQCSIYLARPEQCRRFPFWDYFRNHPDQLFLECPGVREFSISVEDIAEE